jgi:hypothetical protein
MSLEDCTRQAAISRSSTDVPFHLQDMIQRMVVALTESVERLRVMALHVMLHRRGPDKASIQEMMMRVLMKYCTALYVWKNLRTHKLPSQKGVPLEATMNETSSDRCFAGVKGWAGGFLSSCSAGRTDRPTRNGLAIRCQMMGRRLSQLCSAGRTDHRELLELPGVQRGPGHDRPQP